MRFSKLIVFLFGFLLANCSQNPLGSDHSNSHHFYSDLETVDNSLFQTTVPGFQLGGGDLMSTDFARSGHNSLKLDAQSEYGLGGELKNLPEGTFVHISVWQKSGSLDGTLEVQLKSENSESNAYYRTYLAECMPDGKGWVKHSLSFVVDKNIESVVFHVFSGRKVAYFDDFELEYLPSAPANALTTELHLFVPDSSANQLQQYINAAANYEVIPASSKKYVAGQLTNGLDTAAIQLKIKGDWKDHLYSGKTSYRIKIEGPLAFRGMKSFAIQHPKTRHYLDEWVLHQMAEREDVLTTSYGFVNVYKSGIYYGVYAYEEHFDKQLLEQRNRREGPILKLDETGYWSAVLQEGSAGNVEQWPYFQQSAITVFKQGRTMKSAALKSQFNEGQKLVALFKNGEADLEDVFDMNQVAKFYVLAELSGSDHALRWHNRRFYYNPVIQKLECIAYDILPVPEGDSYRCLAIERLNNAAVSGADVFDRALFRNPVFKARYLFHLQEKTNPRYLNAFFDAVKDELEINLAALQGEFEEYQFNRSFYYENAAFLRKSIPELERIWTAKLQNENTVESLVHPLVYEPRQDGGFLKPIALNAYLTENGEQYDVFAENYHLNGIVLRGYDTKGDNGQRIVFGEGIPLKGFTSKSDTVHFTAAEKPSKVYFTVENNPSIVVSQKIMPWKKPTGVTARMKLKAEFNPNTTYYRIVGNQLIFSGRVIVDRVIFIPQNYNVVLSPGTKLEFKTGGGLIVTGDFEALGTVGSPIHIFCADSTSNGLTILNGTNAQFEYVTLSGLSNLNYENWELTGAVTIYETPVKMVHCRVENNFSEDALNIIRSPFDINDLTINTTFSDGFDADFCTGNLVNTRFENTGNDAIDFSGSQVLLERVTIHNAGDKGISGGEKSVLTLNEISVDGAVTGIAAKDGAALNGKNIEISHAEYGCAAFQKKPEYEGATLVLENTTIADAPEKVLVGLGSVVRLNGEIFEGKEKLDIDGLYARFE